MIPRPMATVDEMRRTGEQIRLAVLVLTAFAVAAGLGIALSVDAAFGLVWAGVAALLGVGVSVMIRRAEHSISRP